jgi:acyl carrier protein
MEIKSKVRQFMVTNFYVPDPTALKDDASLLDLGIVDSTGVLEVVGFLEDEFGLQIDAPDLVPENLDSIDRITAFVGRKLGT